MLARAGRDVVDIGVVPRAGGRVFGRPVPPVLAATAIARHPWGTGKSLALWK